MDADMSFSDSEIQTPSWSDFENPSETDYIPTLPCPGKVFMIHLRDTDKVITINEGEVVLQSQGETEPGGGWYWACVEKGNWFGFRNTVSGSYLGHNGKSGLHASAIHHKAHQFLCVGHHSHGGYLLLVKSPGGEEMRHVGCSADMKTLVEKEKDGAQWMFEEV